MSVRIAVGGAAQEAIERILPRLIDEKVASGITAQIPTLWGPDSEDESAKRLGWTEAVATSRALVPEILRLRDRLRSRGLDHVVLSGMGGSSLAPDVIARSQGVDLTVLDSTDPGRVRAALRDRLHRTVVVISSKSGSTLETDSHRRSYEQAFTEAGIDPKQRIVVVTDPGSPLDRSAREAGYPVFNADPNVGGRFSALTAFGLVPTGLAGADIAELLDEAESEELNLAIDARSNNGLILGAAIGGTSPRHDKLGIVTDGTHIVGFGDWVEQLIAESTGKLGTGILPVVLEPDSPEVSANLPDLQIVRLVGEADPDRHRERLRAGEIVISGTLGELMLVWEYAVAVAGRLLGINPFDQPDVESAKVATRALLDEPTTAPPPAFVEHGIEIRATDGLLTDEPTVEAALDDLTARLPEHGYVAVQAYVDRLRFPRLRELRDVLAAKTGRPVTFGWGPGYLHSTGQYHKGGPATGVYLQITADPNDDLPIPGRPFTYGYLIQAQAQGDASVLAEHGRPVLRMNLTDAGAADALLAAAAGR